MTLLCLFCRKQSIFPFIGDALGLGCSYGNTKAKILVLSCDFHHQTASYKYEHLGSVEICNCKSNNTAATVTAISSAKPVRVNRLDTAADIRV